jgi:hypothetical protein
MHQAKASSVIRGRRSILNYTAARMVVCGFPLQWIDALIHWRGIHYTQGLAADMA